MICLLGLGEVGRTFAEDLGAGFTAWDVKFADPDSAPSRTLKTFGLPPPHDVHAAVAQADVVICAVTAAQDEAAARSVSGALKTGTFFMDVNSASPAQKRRAAEVIEGAGGRYVEAVIMSPIGMKRMASPVLLGGPHVAEFLPVAQRIGFSGVKHYSDEIGLASATKLCRSVIVKGMEALLTESMLAARHYGVEEAVLDSLVDFFPGQDWRKLTNYMIRRGLEHGTRRAEEMREAAATMVEAGVPPLLSEATAARQDLSAAQKAALQYENLTAMLDAMRALEET